jgi:threonine/homoserine/homoserine lactone efflux protein
VSVEQWWFFITACTILNVAPGPDTMYIMSNTIAQGRRAGLLSSIGVCSGAMIHASMAGLGLSAALAHWLERSVGLVLVGIGFNLFW